MGFFHFLSDRDRNENNPSRSRTDDHPPQTSILDRYPDRQSCLQTIALLCCQERTLRISVDSKLSLPFGGPPCGSQTIHPNFRLFQNPNRFIENPEGTYFRQGVGLGKSRLLQMILRFQTELGYPIPFIPVGIRYGERSGWRRRVEVCIGSPLFAEKESDAIPLTHRAMEEISRLCRMPQCTD